MVSIFPIPLSERVYKKSKAYVAYGVRGFPNPRVALLTPGQLNTLVGFGLAVVTQPWAHP